MVSLVLNMNTLRMLMVIFSLMFSEIKFIQNVRLVCVVTFGIVQNTL